MSPEASAAVSLTGLPERAGEFLAGSPLRDLAGTGPVTQVRAPFTGQVIGQFRANTPADVEQKIARARLAAPAWARMSVRERAGIVLRLHGLVREYEELLLDLVQVENGKARTHAYDEVLDAYNTIRYVALAAPGALADRAVRGAIPGLTTTRVVHEPVGVVGFISPWNYPLSLGANDVLAALVAGNAVVQKVDSKTPFSVVLMRRLLISAGLPAEVWQLMAGTPEQVGDALLAGVDGVSFTGSTAAGRGIAATAGQRLIPAALELGGKNPMIVAPSADLADAVRTAVRGAFSSTGQLCLSIERIYVVDDGTGTRLRNFIDAFAAATRKLRLGAAYD